MRSSRDALDYIGINPVGLLVTVFGKVTRLDTQNRVFYIDDGSRLADGMGPSYDPFIGLRVAYKAGMTPPIPGKYAKITGIRTIQTTVLAYDAVVNGEYRFAGETLYLPLIKVRHQADMVVIK